MAFNLGAFAGGLAQGGANTYFKMGEMQRQEEELAMRKQEAAYQEELRNQERELNKITALTLGSGDKRMVADQSTVNQGYEGADGPAATGYKEVAYTPQQQMADFKQRALAAGVPLQKVTAVSGAHRAEKYAEKEELALDFNNQVMSDVKANPNDLGAVFKKHFEPLYNEGKLPGLNDGSKVELIPDGKGGQSMLFKDAKGKPTQPPVPLDIHAMEAITQKWGDLMLRSSNPANYWRSRDTDLKERELGYKGEEVGIKKALLPSEIAKNMGAANQANMHASVYGNMLQTAKESKEAGKAMQPFLDEFAAMTPEDQNGAKGQAVLLKGATAGAQKSKDLAGIVSMLRKPDRALVSAEQEKAAYAAYNEATTPAQIEAVKAKYPAVFGEDPLTKQVREALEAKKRTEGTGKTQAAETQAKTAIPAPAPAAAKPQTAALASVAAPYQQRLGELAPMIEAAQQKVRAGGGLAAARELQTLTQERDKILANPVMK